MIRIEKVFISEFEASELLAAIAESPLVQQEPRNVAG